MYVRQFGYTIVPGQEEKAAGLCTRFAASLRERGLRAHVLIGGHSNSTIQLREEYASVEVMHAAQAALECNENYRSAVSVWAAEFYPLVQAAQIIEGVRNALRIAQPSAQRQTLFV